jgi:hypothetical protein
VFFFFFSLSNFVLDKCNCMDKMCQCCIILPFSKENFFRQKGDVFRVTEECQCTQTEMLPYTVSNVPRARVSHVNHFTIQHGEVVLALSLLRAVPCLCLASDKHGQVAEPHRVVSLYSHYTCTYASLMLECLQEQLANEDMTCHIYNMNVARYLGTYNGKLVRHVP